MHGSSPWRWMFRCVMTQSARVGHSLEATHGVGCSGVGALEFRPPVGPLIPRRRIAPRNPADYIFIRGRLCQIFGRKSRVLIGGPASGGCRNKDGVRSGFGKFRGGSYHK
ncbi:Glutamate receptor family protein [Prunus dulcis]|uniref:Glutamate receptor family protein n=1 Tax=Prunus dulcis TaxID=3755 RepID=A0A4Y1QUC5_PRUDU|nr:Glutamate receptor family protein [Prunus dulcis]